MDIGVGDAAWPPPESRLYPALLDLPTGHVLAYVPVSGILPLLRTFLLPILHELRRGGSDPGVWPAGGPWR